MNSLENMFLSLTAAIRARTTNPITGTYLLSWVVVNYKFFVLLFMGNSEPEQRLEAIAALYQPDLSWLIAWGMPALITLGFLFAYPFCVDWLVLRYRRQQVRLANKLREAEGARLLSESQGVALYDSYDRHLVERTSRITSLENENENLRVEIKRVKELLDAHPRKEEMTVPFATRKAHLLEKRAALTEKIFNVFFSRYLSDGRLHDMGVMRDIAPFLNNLFADPPLYESPAVDQDDLGIAFFEDAFKLMSAEQLLEAIPARGTYHLTERSIKILQLVADVFPDLEQTEAPANE